MVQFIAPHLAELEICSMDNVWFTTQNLGIVGRFPTYEELRANYLRHSGKIIATLHTFNVTAEEQLFPRIAA